MDSSVVEDGAIAEIIGTIVVKGVKYIVRRAIDGFIDLLIDEDDNGEPDNPDFPDIRIPIDTETKVEKSIIIVSPDGTMCIYDENGNIVAEDCDLAYSLWVADNNIMSKSLDTYSVSEGLLALLVLFTVLKFVWGLFTRKDVLR